MNGHCHLSEGSRDHARLFPFALCEHLGTCEKVREGAGTLQVKTGGISFFNVVNIISRRERQDRLTRTIATQPCEIACDTV
jgi:hypothetical protein